MNDIRINLKNAEQVVPSLSDADLWVMREEVVRMSANVASGVQTADPLDLDGLVELVLTECRMRRLGE